MMVLRWHCVVDGTKPISNFLHDVCFDQHVSSVCLFCWSLRKLYRLIGWVVSAACLSCWNTPVVSGSSSVDSLCLRSPGVEASGGGVGVWERLWRVPQSHHERLSPGNWREKNKLSRVYLTTENDCLLCWTEMSCLAGRPSPRKILFANIFVRRFLETACRKRWGITS